MTFLGVDAGTTRIKAALADERGQILAQSARDARVLRPREGWCEMDMEALWGLLCEITGQLKADAGAAWEGLAGVGIAAQGDGLWAVGKDGRPVGPAILWNDTRTRGFHLERREELDTYLAEHHATPIFSGSLPLLLAWRKAHEPERYRRTARVFHCKDWLNFKLTGVAATDYSDRSNASTDIFTKELLPASLELMGIPEALPLHPPAHPSAHVLGGVSAEGEKATGIRKGTPVIAGAMDVTAVSLGAGMHRPGESCTILGTTLCNEMLIPKGRVDHRDRHGSVLCGILPDSYLRVMAAQSGASAIDWARGILAPELSFDQIEAAITGLPAGAGGVLYHPYLQGERAPFKSPGACGGFYGLCASHDRFSLLRAVYEGVVFSLKDCYAHLPAGQGSLYLAGGGARSRLLCQLIADALDKEVVRPEQGELGIRGIVHTVKTALQLDSGTGETPAKASRFTPRPEIHRRLEEPYAAFLSLRREMEPFWAARARWQ